MPVKDIEETLGYVAAKVNSLYDLTLTHIQDGKEENKRLRKVEIKVSAIYIVGPILVAIAGLVSAFMPWSK